MEFEEYVARLTADPCRQGLRELVRVRAVLDQVELLLVERLRRQGASWTRIGEDLGLSRATAHRRYAARR